MLEFKKILMKNNNHIVGITATAFVIVVIVTVWCLLFGETHLSLIKAWKQHETKEVEAEKKLLDISSVDEAYDAILNKSTKEFIGYHPINEEFLSWFCSRYGVEAIESIAAYSELSDANIWHQITGSSIHVLWYYYCKDTGVLSYSYEKTFEKNCQSSYQVVMDFTGDFSLAEGVGTTTYFHSVGDDLTKCLDEDLLAEMSSSDIMVVNNEFVYSNRGEPLPGKDYIFRGDPSLSDNLTLMGTDVAGLANNHVYDYGEIGLLDTLDAISQQEIPTIGAGKNIEHASEPVYFIANGKKIAIVAATQIERSLKYTKEATETEAGVFKTLNPEKYAKAIAKAKKNADYVICYVHWGTEHTNQYGGDQKVLAKTFVAAGADVIVGCHSHCLQGVDWIEGVPVYYSLGNFYFSQEPEMPEDYDTAMAQIIIEADGSIQAKMLPCHFSNGKLSLVKSKEQYLQILNDVNSYSDGAKIDADGTLIVPETETYTINGDNNIIGL